MFIPIRWLFPNFWSKDVKERRMMLVGNQAHDAISWGRCMGDRIRVKPYTREVSIGIRQDLRRSARVSCSKNSLQFLASHLSKTRLTTRANWIFSPPTTAIQVKSDTSFPSCILYTPPSDRRSWPPCSSPPARLQVESAPPNESPCLSLQAHP